MPKAEMRSDRVLTRLMQLHPKKIDLSLGRIERLLALLGDPHEKLPPVIHVAGTKGKGSTVATMRACLEAAGYRVIDDAEEQEADVLIASVGEDIPQDSSGKTIWLRTDPEVANKKDESIYRYDRAGLLMALKSAGAGRGK